MQQVNIERRYCQSCGMPLNIEKKEFSGTDRDGNKLNEYCRYCFQNGEYTANRSMAEAIETWLPSLKRQQQKNTTKKIHYEIVNNVLTYINNHLFEELDAERLSKVANLSKFYLIRVFKDITGESIGNYMLRIRLEYIAHLMVTTDLPLNDIVNDVHYHSRHSLSKAFKKYFGLSPLEYRQAHKVRE
ncbi:zinc ribbon domain-containing protein [Prevotella sp. 10(H)]|uniref:zinc ribbon domain-containing protein n=1 Tax=Prevotella sp. 10(H) TaxID=1158294 RepID=UPI0004A72B37|nr:zinc ribbon domain-containing protein [Prevotella sp. 10(H)]